MNVKIQGDMGRPLRALMAAVTLLGLQMLRPSDASAAPSCLGAGYLCFYDYATSNYGNVAGDNNRWSALPGGWDNRADWFYNEGRTHNVCVYQNVNRGGVAVHIPRYWEVLWDNTVSSNAWTQSTTSCPR